MKFKDRIFCIILLLLFSANINSCKKTETKLTMMEQGFFETKEMKSYLLSDVEMIEITNESETHYHLSINNTIKNITASSSNNIVAIGFPDHIYNHGDNRNYRGKVEIYSFNYNSKSFILEDTLIPYGDQSPAKKYEKEDGSYYPGENFFSSSLKLYKDKLLVNAGEKTVLRIPKDFKGLDREEAFEKIKQQKLFKAELNLYSKDQSWRLSQIVNADLGYNYTNVRIEENEIEFFGFDFGYPLAISDNYFISYQRLPQHYLHLYKRSSENKFKLLKKLKTDYLVSQVAMTDQFTIYTDTVHWSMNRVNVINNKTGEIETNLRAPVNSPIASKKRDIGHSLSINSKYAFVGEIPKTGVKGFCPGYVHVFKNNKGGKWILNQTIKSPFNLDREMFGNYIVSDDKYLVVTSRPYNNVDVDKNTQAKRIIYLYEIQVDDSFKLIKVIIDRSKGFSQDIEELTFFEDGLIYALSNGSVKYIPNLIKKNK